MSLLVKNVAIGGQKMGVILAQALWLEVIKWRHRAKADNLVCLSPYISSYMPVIYGASLTSQPH